MPLGTEVGLSPVDIVLDWEPAPAMERGDPAPPTERGTAASPHFSAHVYCVAKRSPISATSELLLVSVVLSMTVVGIWWCSGNVNNFHRNGEYSVVTTMQ